MRPFYDANVPLGRIGEASEIADAMVWQASYVSGQTITVDGGRNIKMSVANL